MNKEIVLQERRSFIATGYEICYTTDFGNETKRVISKVNLIAADGQKYDYPELVIWEGEAYDKIGQWTDDDLKKRIEELLNT